MEQPAPANGLTVTAPTCGGRLPAALAVPLPRNSRVSVPRYNLQEVATAAAFYYDTGVITGVEAMGERRACVHEHERHRDPPMTPGDGAHPLAPSPPSRTCRCTDRPDRAAGLCAVQRQCKRAAAPRRCAAGGERPFGSLPGPQGGGCRQAAHAAWGGMRFAPVQDAMLGDGERFRGMHASLRHPAPCLSSNRTNG